MINYNAVDPAKAVSTAGIDIYTCISDYKAEEISGRFFNLASILPADGMLGLQISTQNDEKISGLVFSNTELAVDDVAWVFRECAKLQDYHREIKTDVFGPDRKVYIFKRKHNNANLSFDGYFKDEWGRPDKSEECCGFLKMINSTGAFLGIIAGPDDEKGIKGTIMLSLPDKISLRMRTAISILLAGSELNEYDCAEPAEYNDDQLTAEQLVAFMSLLVRSITVYNQNDSVSDALKLQDEEDIFNEDDTKLTDFIADGENDPHGTILKIEQLDLSLRAFNCLKRAGINTVEELQWMSDDDLLKVRNLGKKSIAEIKKKIAGIPVPEDSSLCKKKQNYSAMLNDLIGLREVKQSVKQITAFAKMKKDMAEAERISVPAVFNMEFKGNPGTAKTTVARIMAGIFFEAGIIPCNELTEVGRADLIGKYTGQTADKVKSIFLRAKGGVLFIDEAYALIDDCRNGYGDEAIATIVQEMENNREDTIVIFAGYPEDMEVFFARNPGLRSRVPFSIHFEDYSVEELMQITSLEAEQRGFMIDRTAGEKIGSIFRSITGNKNAGNGRLCRNLVEKAIFAYALRFYGDGNEVHENDYTLIAEDFTVPNLKTEKAADAIGFCRN